MNKAFIAMADKNKKGYGAEKKVWDAVEKSFSHRNSFAYWNYPVFDSGYNSRKEPDILLFDKELGITIIEVKGINIANIESINGHQWSYLNYFVEKGDPYQQAEHQMYSLLEWLPNMHEKFTKRVLVALPYITKAEWKGKGFDKLPSNPPIIFKDDLETDQIFNTISSTFLAVAKERLLDEDWNYCRSLFGSSINEEVGNDETHGPKYSLLFIPSTPEEIAANQFYFLELLKRGIKVTILSVFDRNEKWFKHDVFDLSEEAFLFQFVLSDTFFSIDSKVVMKDGEGLNKRFMDKWLLHFSKFNKEQYAIEHAAIDDNLMIEAGAGTGKTMVMIHRIFFLLSMIPELTLKDIVMITFTRESAGEMKRRLKKELMIRQDITKLPIYLHYAEQLKEMNVQTIHSFAKSLLDELGFTLGFGRNVRLTSFTEKRREIISKALDEYSKSEGPGNVVIKRNKRTLRNFERIKVIESFWNEMDSKGLTQAQIKDLVWSTSDEGESADKVNRLFEHIFDTCEREFEKLKKDENAITIGDLVRKISEISNDSPEALKELSNQFKYLFVDEFQDSDDVQIRLVAQLYNMLQAKIFVVGDVKQSIYRFRGADYTAFKQLESHVSKQFVKQTLRINYRTSKSLVARLDERFSKWNKEGNLIYAEGDSMVSYIPSSYPENEYLSVPYYKKKEIKDLLVKVVLDASEKARAQHSTSKKKIAILVRTNGQAKQAFDWLNDQNVMAEMNVGGTFFTTDAVKDFHTLLHALLYPEDAKALLDLFATPYFRDQITVDELIVFEGSNEKILAHLRREYSETYHVFQNSVTELRHTPIFAILRKFMKNDIYQNVYTNMVAITDGITPEIRKKFKFEVEKYRTDLNHLMNIIHSQFDSTKATLYSLHKWLGIKIMTDRTEDQPMIDSSQSAEAVEIVTVHKSKGLEYHTVIMPFTDFPFNNERDEILFDTERKQVGWSIMKGGFSSNLHKILKSDEVEEVVKEETRLLYVAMTRARERLIIMEPHRAIDSTWSHLLRG